MPRRKVTFEYDPAESTLAEPHEFYVGHWIGVDRVTVEDLPEPPIRQRFIAEYTGFPGIGPLKASAVHARLREGVYRDGTWSITEVDGA